MLGIPSRHLYGCRRFDHPVRISQITHCPQLDQLGIAELSSALPEPQLHFAQWHRSTTEISYEKSSSDRSSSCPRNRHLCDSGGRSSQPWFQRFLWLFRIQRRLIGRQARIRNWKRKLRLQWRQRVQWRQCVQWKKTPTQCFQRKLRLHGECIEWRQLVQRQLQIHGQCVQWRRCLQRWLVRQTHASCTSLTRFQWQLWLNGQHRFHG